MLGLVRLFCEKVKDTEKEANSCLRRVLVRTTQRTRSTSALAPKLLHKDEDSEDLHDLWKKGRQLLKNIDCSAGSAPTLPIRQLFSSSNGEPQSTIWRENNDTITSDMEIEAMRGSNEDEFISLPKVAPTANWNLNSDDIEVLRGQETIGARYSLLPPVQPMDFTTHESEPSTHFLDLLLDKHDSMSTGDYGLEESGLSSGDGDVFERIGDLLAPPGHDLAEDNFLQSFYEESDYDFNATGYQGYYDDSDSGAAFDMDIGRSTSQSSTFARSTDPHASTAKTRANKPFVYPVDDIISIPHDETRELVENFDKRGPRPDLDVLSDYSLVALNFRLRRFGLRKFGTLPQVMGMPEGKSTVVSGAWAFVELIHQMHIAQAPLSAVGTLEELSFMPQDSTSSSGGEVAAVVSIPTYIPLLGSPGGTIILNGDEEDFGGEIWRGEDGDAMAAGGIENNRDSGPLFAVEHEDLEAGQDLERMADFEQDPLLPTEDAFSPRKFVLDPSAGPSFDSLPSAVEARSPIGSSTGISFDLFGADKHSKTQTSLTETPQQPKGVSKALLNYLTIKATISTTDSSTSHNKSLQDNSTSTDEQKLVSSFIDERKSSYSLFKLLAGCKRRTAARTFLHLLELAAISSIGLDQQEPFGDVSILVDVDTP